MKGWHWLIVAGIAFVALRLALAYLRERNALDRAVALKLGHQQYESSKWLAAGTAIQGVGQAIGGIFRFGRR